MVLWDFSFCLILVFFKKSFTFKHKKKLMNKKFNSFNKFIAEWETITFPLYCFVNELALSSIKFFFWCSLKHKVVKYLLFLVFSCFFFFALLDQLLHGYGTLNMSYNLLGLEKIFSCSFFIHIHHLFHFIPFLLQM
jgi:hypothetical protein